MIKKLFRVKKENSFYFWLLAVSLLVVTIFTTYSLLHYFHAVDYPIRFSFDDNRIKSFQCVGTGIFDSPVVGDYLRCHLSLSKSAEAKGFILIREPLIGEEQIPMNGFFIEGEMFPKIHLNMSGEEYLRFTIFFKDGTDASTQTSIEVVNRDQYYERRFREFSILIALLSFIIVTIPSGIEQIKKICIE